MKFPTLETLSKRVAKKAMNEIIVELNGQEMPMSDFLSKLSDDGYSLCKVDKVIEEMQNKRDSDAFTPNRIYDEIIEIIKENCI